MAIRIGDTVVYARNNIRGYGENYNKLLKRPKGKIIGSAGIAMDGLSLIDCAWEEEDGGSFNWCVPKSYVKKIK